MCPLRDTPPPPRRKEPQAGSHCATLPPPPPYPLPTRPRGPRVKFAPKLFFQESFYITIRHIHPPQQILQHGVGGEERSLPRAARTRQDQQVSAVVAPPLIPGSGPTPDPRHVAWPGLLSGAGTASSSPPAPHFLSQPPRLRQLQERILGLRAGRNPGDFQVSSFSVRQIGVTGGYRLVST